MAISSGILLLVAISVQNQMCANTKHHLTLSFGKKLQKRTNSGYF